MSVAGPPLSTYDYNVTTVVSHSAELNVPYALCEILVAVCAVVGNGLVILVFAKERKLRRRTNYYIISLATADLLVGLFAIPFAILASIGLPTNLHACLFTVSVLVVLCTISIFCLVAVSIDRYWAILHPMGYSRTVRTKTAIVIICVCWIAGTLVGFLPLFGWNAGTHKSNVTCIFTKVMDYDYLVFLYFATIIFPALLIAAFYAHIYRVVVKQLQQIVTMNPGKRKENQTHGTMLRLLGAAQKREVKATQNLSRIVVFFIICWFPLYTINCVMAFCPGCEVSEFLLNFCIILSHLNSAGNPLLYAYHLKDFRAALKSFIHRIITGRPDVKQIPGPSGMVSIIREPRGSTMDSQRGLSMRGRMQQQLLAAGTATTMTTITAGTTDTTGAARNASLLRAVHESRMRELQQAANQSTRDVLHDIAEKSDPENIEIANLSGEGATGAMDNTNQIESAVTTTETTALTAVTDDDSTLEVRTYDFNAKLQYVDGVEDEDEDDENVDGDNRIPTSQQDSMLVIEADVNQSVSSRERLTLDEVDIHD